MTGEEQTDDRHGLFDGFEGYRTPSDEDYRRVLTAGLVVPDANVLLNLYRYNTQSRVDLFAVLEKLGSRLWVPHQVLVEFWRNRESVLRDPQKAGQETVEALRKQRDQTAGVLRNWTKRTALAPDLLAQLLDPVGQSFDNLIKAVTDMVGEESDLTQNTNDDVVIQTLQRVLSGRVGLALDRTDHEAAVQEGRRRIAEGIPPGYKDKGKSDDHLAVGDYLVWAQLLREAGERGCDVLFVTGDVKEDWWRQEHGQTRGPRLELVEELRSVVGTNLFMLRPENLLRRAKEALEVEVDPASVQDVERVDRSLSVDSTGGWNAEAIDMLLETLAFEAHVQCATIRFAAANDGFVSREKVYELGGYHEGRTLKGFTRPPNRIAQRLKTNGILPDDAVDVLESVYDSAFSYVQASGFRVPQQLIPLIQEWSVQAE